MLPSNNDIESKEEEESSDLLGSVFLESFTRQPQNPEDNEQLLPYHNLIFGH